VVRASLAGGISDMRYRIQIEPIMGCTLIIVSKFDGFGGRLSSTTKMYTIDEDDVDARDIVEVLGQLQRLIGESQG
jgi:hypothetical protein